MLDRSIYRSAFRREAEALQAAARLGLTAPVPSCPGWTVTALVAHLIGSVYAEKLEAVRQRPSFPRSDGYQELGLPESFTRWLTAGNYDVAVPPTNLLDYFLEAVGKLEAELYALDPEEPLATWWPPSQTAGFYQRRLAHENAIHRWDVQLAHGVVEPLEPELATDGIEEMFDVHLFARREWAEQPRLGTGETYHFHRTDGPGEWLLSFEPAGPTIKHEHAKGDVALRGTASDLLLWLWGRIPADRLQVFGDQALLQRYFELVPPD